VFEGYTGEIENAIVDCALRYGERCVAAGDPGRRKLGCTTRAAG